MMKSRIWIAPWSPGASSVRLAFLSCALLLAACAQPGGNAVPLSSTAPAVVSTDAAGRVVRERAGRNLDDSIGQAVLFQLRRNDAGAFKGVSVLAWDRAVLLTGAVTKPEQRRRAEQIARATDGVGTVFNDLCLDEDPASAAFVPETGREQRIYAGLLGQDGIAGAYVVRMVNGVVTLMGTARSADDVARAAAFAGDADGVKWVVNHVAVK